jgi:hypothetical protein
MYDDPTKYQPAPGFGAPNITYCSCAPGSYKHIEKSLAKNEIVCIPCDATNGLDAAVCLGSVQDTAHRQHIQPYPMGGAAMIGSINSSDVRSIWCDPYDACIGMYRVHSFSFRSSNSQLSCIFI